jgi:hypothetical protein
MTERASTKLSLLDGENYECLILKPSGRFNHFQRVGYVRFAPVSLATWTKTMTEQRENGRLYARNLLHKQFTDGEISASICGRPDHAGMYTISLV